MEAPPVIHLKDPDELAIEHAYRTLPSTGEVTAECDLQQLSGLLVMLEKRGFAGMTVRVPGREGYRIHIVSYKGKQGACYHTGRTARYQGGALAVMDDDHHLLLAGEEMAVCEKTALLYSFPAYGRMIRCAGADRELLQKLRTDPEPFESDAFENSMERVFKLIRDQGTAEGYRELFYPGPFKLLILIDGTLVRRGSVNRVPLSLSKKLIRSDGLFELDRIQGRPHESFIELYNTRGPVSLLNDSPETVISDSAHPPDFILLRQVGGAMKARLIQTIEQEKDYFMLTGSNREDQFGCCPSDEVTMADSLVRAGILSSSREAASVDACPITIYAFRGEMILKEGMLRFEQDRDFRQEIRSGLNDRKRHILKKTATWTLLLFVALTLVIAVTRVTGPSVIHGNRGLYEQLAVSIPEGTAVVLFHYSKRCEQCLALEKYTREVLGDQFPGLLERKQLQFGQVIIDQQANRELVEELGLITSTVVIFQFHKMEVDQIIVLDRSWALYDREKEFKQMLSEELHQLLGGDR